MIPYRLPLKFIGVWVLNLAVLLGISYGLGLQNWLFETLRLRDLTWIYLLLGALMASLEEYLWDKLKGNS